MSYCRNPYIWSDGTNMNFPSGTVAEDELNVYVSQLYDKRHDEFKERVKKGRKTYECSHTKQEVDDGQNRRE